jgi:predicted phosphate transport protein (TIGR00153 family)
VRILPQDKVFFDLFDAQVDAVGEAAAAFSRLAADFGRLGQEIQTLDEIEHRADGITHELANRVDRMFVTPFDKDDISLLAGRLDDIIDFLEAAISRMGIYQVGSPPPELLPFSQRFIEAASLLSQAIKSLRQIKSREEMRQLFVEIHRVENDCDTIYRHALARMYELVNPGPQELLDLMKWKEIFDRLETAMDACEDAANVVESMVVKYA